ncbi:MAG: EFR1 family ferrodoxin [Bacteroidales bacterium]|jgi:NAD-dependent dihydropyrimidine dehydrogenase PreA subunit|nr:EFR1 family ferrodoxin [Bacteroidales bacterium]
MIFYFSGTGNTRWVARQMAEITGEKLFFIPEELNGGMQYHLEEGERIGFCFPIHGWQPPHIVRDFIFSMNIDNAEGHYCYCLCTCGDSIGLGMNVLQRYLSKKALHADAMVTIQMPESYVALPGMYTDTPEKEKLKIDNATLKIKEISPKILNRESFEDIKKGPIPWTLTHIVGAFFNGKMITDKPFRVDAEKCVHCGACADNCPTKNVVLEDGLPKWKHERCTACLACYHHCPVHAINYGSVTKKRGQYYFKDK